jgi:DNA-binding response OmpR family regulator
MPTDDSKSDPPLAAPAATGSPSPRAERARVLLVEDDEAVRRLVESCLKLLGYDAVVVSDAASALARFAADDDIRLLLTDANLPGMTGCQLAVALRRQAPSLGVIVMSGDLDTVTASGDPLLASIDWLQKPFTLAELSARIRSQLATDAAARRPCE